MKALLLAAGLGTRLRPLTDHTPKCLVPIGDRPLLSIWVDLLLSTGIREIVINTHYLADQVEAWWWQHPNRNCLRLAHEPVLLGTAGSLLQHVPGDQKEPILVAHADNLIDADLSAFLAAHRVRPSDCDMTMMLFHTDEPQRCGIVERDEAGRVVAFHEKVQHPPSDLANAAVYVMEASVLRELRAWDPSPVDLSLDVIPRQLGHIATWVLDGYLRDIGTPEALTRGCQEYLDRHRPLSQ